MAHKFPAYVCPAISRVDIAWACVATSDPNPLHLDPAFAIKERGYKDVLVPGTMLAGWIGEYLEYCAEQPENIVRWRVRFTAPLWPGDQVTLTAQATEGGDSREGVVNCEVTATTEDGRVVARASAELRMEQAVGAIEKKEPK